MLPHEAKNIPEFSPGIGLDFPLQKCADQIQISPDSDKLPVYHKVTGAFTIALYQSHDQIHGHAKFAIPLFPCFQRTAFCVIGTANAAFLLENGVIECHHTVLVHRWSFQHRDGLPGKGNFLFLSDTTEVQHLQYRTVQLRFFSSGTLTFPTSQYFGSLISSAPPSAMIGDSLLYRATFLISRIDYAAECLRRRISIRRFLMQFPTHYHFLRPNLSVILICAHQHRVLRSCTNNQKCVIMWL